MWRSLYICVHSNIIPNSKTMESPKVPLTDNWKNKTMEYNSALERKPILTHATTKMNLE